METRVFGNATKREHLHPVPNLCDLQVRKFNECLQRDIPAHRRDPSVGIEAVLRDIFPIESYDGRFRIEYADYKLLTPRYTPDECRKLRLTYGMPFRARLRLVKEEPITEEVYLGEIPLMLGGGEFIINGVDRVVVNQLHRSPGVDFSEVTDPGTERRLHRSRLIPERGSWVELEVMKKDVLRVRIDQSGKMSATTLLRAFSDEFSDDRAIIRAFHKTERIALDGEGAELAKVRILVSDLTDQRTGEVLLEAGEVIPEEFVRLLGDRGVTEVEVLAREDEREHLILNTLKEDTTRSTEEALLEIYRRLRPGYPPDVEKARVLLKERFFDKSRYCLGKVGRFRINRKFDLPVETNEDVLVLLPEDYVRCIRYILDLRAERGGCYVDDIDHLENRRVRTIDELVADEFRRGCLRMKRSVQEQMQLQDEQEMTPRTLVRTKPALDGLFQRGELSQIVDSTNPLAQLTHERRLSALGPGGLNRKRAGFEVRDVHISHYGRICPIETPEGTNIGLIASLGIYARVDPLGFLVTPYQVVSGGRLAGEVRYLRADEERGRVIAPADIPVADDGLVATERVIARRDGDFVEIAREEIEYMDVSPRQLVGVSASLIPFLEHDDANRALMGSNMQRQAVPLLCPERAHVATGMEREVARNSGMVVLAEEPGTVVRATAEEIAVDDRVYRLKKFQGLSEKTCLNQRPAVRKGERVEAGQVIADGAATLGGELALGRAALAGFMSWEGYNFEDAIVISERLVIGDAYTSVHIEEFEAEVRETELGREEITADVPNVSRRAISQLGEDGIIRTGARVGPGDILVGKVAPKSKTELTPEEKLLRAIFGRMGEEVRNESLEVPPGVEGIVIGAEKFCRKTHMTEEERAETERQEKEIKAHYDARRDELVTAYGRRLERLLGGDIRLRDRARPLMARDLLTLSTENLRDLMTPERIDLPKEVGENDLRELTAEWLRQIEEVEVESQRKIERLTKGDQLQPGVLELVKVYVATKRKISVGDKMAGRHGNKGVVAKILPVEDMPFLEDGTPLEIVLNPLGVPSRMNVGQILETHLGWAARVLGFQAVTPVFDGCKEEEAADLLEKAGLPRSGMVRLYDGRTGEPFDQNVTVGYIYMLKLHHMVDDKIHARATGPYSLITQQPLGGKTRFGGQRFGEMEVWALEAYGAAHILQELLTVKSDDVDGRAKIYEAMVRGENLLDPGTPVSFEVLTHEIKGLALNMELEKKHVGPGSPPAPEEHPPPGAGGGTADLG